MTETSQINLKINDIFFTVNFAFSHADPSVGIFEPNIYDVKLAADFLDQKEEIKKEIVSEIISAYKNVYK